jgi:integrase
LAVLATQCDNPYTRLTLEDYKSCQIWLEGYNSPSTKRTYKIHLSLFCKYPNTDPEAGVQSFLESNDIVVLNWKKIAKYYPEQVTNNLRAYTKEEIAKFLSMGDLRDRCLILLMASTGMRVGAIKSLKIKHLTRLQQENKIYFLVLLFGL